MDRRHCVHCQPQRPQQSDRATGPVTKSPVVSDRDRSERPAGAAELRRKIFGLRARKCFVKGQHERILHPEPFKDEQFMPDGRQHQRRTLRSQDPRGMRIKSHHHR